jgi:hypothetical protein
MDADSHAHNGFGGLITHSSFLLPTTLVSSSLKAAMAPPRAFEARSGMSWARLECHKNLDPGV